MTISDNTLEYIHQLWLSVILHWSTFIGTLLQSVTTNAAKAIEIGAIHAKIENPVITVFIIYNNSAINRLRTKDITTVVISPTMWGSNYTNLIMYTVQCLRGISGLMIQASCNVGQSRITNAWDKNSIAMGYRYACYAFYFYLFFYAKVLVIHHLVWFKN